MKARRAPYITPFLFLVICISWVTESLIYRPDNRLISFSSKRIEYIFRNAFCKNRFSIFLGEFEQIKKENSVLNQNVQDAKQEIESLKRQVEEEKLR